MTITIDLLKYYRVRSLVRLTGWHEFGSFRYAERENQDQANFVKNKIGLSVYSV